ncbi:MAG: hypothetical protein M1816_005670 [Peltula sp. TS41687]|nr:MAG: hypothetical protein M1816_005670 [Peltula sp. TS41687]
MYAETIATRNTVGSEIRALVQSGRPHIDIILKNQRDAYISTYTSSDIIEGEVVIRASADAPFDSLYIDLIGQSKTYLDRVASMSIDARTEAQHTFLKLAQPISESAYPVPRVIEAGRTYRYPFTFVIPERLLPTICQHRCESQQVHEAHLQLPPSLGDPTVAGDGSILLDDMAPAMSRVVYSIKAKLTRTRSDGQEVTVGEGLKKIRIVPASEELPPLRVTDAESEEYILRRHKDVKKGMFKGRLGSLSVEAAQPRSLRLPPARPMGSGLTSTMATIAVRFDPAKGITGPPRLGQLVTKLKVKTHFATEPVNDFPVANSALYAYGNGRRGSFSETIQLSSRCVGSVQWESHDEAAEASARRDSNISTSSTSPLAPLPEPTPRYTSGTFWTAKILVPISLPKGKLFVPTFHSCLISRVYTLELSLAASSSSTNAGLSGTTVTLRVPLQISSSGMSVFTTTQREAEAEADEHLRPRTISPLPEAYTGTSDLSSGPTDQSSPSAAQQEEQNGRSNFTSDTTQGPPPGYSFFCIDGAGQVPTRIPSPIGIAPICG